MKANRRAVLKGLIAGAAGIAGMGFANKAEAKVVHSMGKAAAKSKYPTEPTTYRALGKLVFISGMACYAGELAEGVEKDKANTIENHTKVAMAKVKAALEEAGSSLSKVLRVTAWIDDIANYGPMNRAYDGSYPNARRVGARSCMAAPKGGIPGGSLVKFDAIAYI